jgi:hypothetical protein
MPSGSPKDEYLDASNNQRQFQTLFWIASMIWTF